MMIGSRKKFRNENGITIGKGGGERDSREKREGVKRELEREEGKEGKERWKRHRREGEERGRERKKREEREREREREREAGVKLVDQHTSTKTQHTLITLVTSNAV